MVLGAVRQAWSVTILAIGELVDIDLDRGMANGAINADVRSDFVVPLFGFTHMTVVAVGGARRIGMANLAIGVGLRGIGMMAIARGHVSAPEGGVVAGCTVIRGLRIGMTVLT